MMDTDGENVVIPLKEYSDLLRSAKVLEALRRQGVDNWDGWDDAMERLAEEDEE